MAATFHVAITGDDANDGSIDRPFRTIGAAAAQAYAGDTIQVGAGVYREHVDPPRGGRSAEEPITYTAAPGAHVVITGSDPITGWRRRDAGLWELVVPSSAFGAFNPYAERVHGDWFDGRGRIHRRGNVFLDGVWLPEVETRAALQAGAGLGWTSTVDGLVDGPAPELYGVEGHAAFEPAVFAPDGKTTILARFPDEVDPNAGRVEVSVRPTVFTPTAEHIDFITVRGFEMRNAATNWVAPTAGQEGMVTAYWSRGWVIEDNEICYSRCAGIALAKNRDEFDGERGTTDGYYLTIADALDRDGWSRETIGSHIVRNNRIHHCGQVGIVGSLGCAFSTIEGNDVHDCNLQGIWSGAEMAGIKLHGAIDVTIRGNHIHRCGEPAGIWLDWMAQGTHVVANLLHDNVRDIFTEVNHGPILIADNIMLSDRALLSNSRGVVVAHNLLMGSLEVWHDDRETPFMKPHSTGLAEMRRVCTVGDAHWANNILGPAVDLHEYDKAADDLPCTFTDNVTLSAVAGLVGATVAGVALEDVRGSWWLSMSTPVEWHGTGALLSTDSFPPAAVPRQAVAHADGTPVVLDQDYLGAPRGARVAPGPFERGAVGAVAVWPRPSAAG